MFVRHCLKTTWAGGRLCILIFIYFLMSFWRPFYYHLEGRSLFFFWFLLYWHSREFNETGIRQRQSLKIVWIRLHLVGNETYITHSLFMLSNQRVDLPHTRLSCTMYAEIHLRTNWKAFFRIFIIHFISHNFVCRHYFELGTIAVLVAYLGIIAYT